MYKSKREVDKFVKDLNEKYRSENDRSSKGFTVAKLYFNIGEYASAIAYLDKYDAVRKSSSQSLKLRGQIYQAQSASAESTDKSRLQYQALKSYRQSVELDLSQTDLLLVIAELMLCLPIEEQGKARYWLEQAEAIFPQNKSVKKLREKINCVNEGVAFEETKPDDDSNEELNGNGAHGDSDDNSAFWSATTGGGTSFLNNSIARLEMRAETTSTPRFSGTPGQTRRFVPRPSPERLAAQVRNFEANQEKLLGYIQESNRSLVEVNEAILRELQLTREDYVKSVNEQVKSTNAIVAEMQGYREETGRQLRDNTRALKDVKSELVSLCEDMMRQLKCLVTTMRASKDEVDEEKTQAQKPPVKVEPSDVNELLLQQFARLPPYQQLTMLQMSTHIAAASMLPTMLPNVAPQPLPGLPIIQTPQMTGIGNVGGQAPRVLPPSPVQPSPIIPSSLPVSKASEVADAKDSPFSTFTSSPFNMAGLTPLPKQADPKPSQPFNNFFSNLNADKSPSTSFLSNEKTLTSSFGFSTPTAPLAPVAPTFSFAGAAAEAAQRATVADENDDNNVHDESAEHDPHFEPIIPLPELVEVKTGEEDEVEKFAYKAKVYRFDPDAKEWKERGVGTLKILQHPTKGTYRVLLRREQVHKIAANHMITKEIELKPLNNSATAVCYYAMDFAEETLKLEHLAVRFKLEETMIEFKKVFKECQDNIKDKKPDVTPKEEVTNEKKDLKSLEMFKPKIGSWECAGCLCRNDASAIQCPACLTPKPGHEKEVKNDSAASKFGGDGPSGSFNFSSSSTPTSGFKFGVVNNAPTTSTSSPSGFVFGGAASGGSSIFGKPAEPSVPAASNKPTETNPTTIFGSKAAEPSGSGPSIFGGKPGGFNFGPTTSSTTPPTTTASSGVFSSFAFGNKGSTPAASSEQKSSVFSSFSFGVPSPKSQEVKTEEGSSGGVDLSASKNLTSFADLATPGKGFGFGNSNSTGFSFGGHAAPLFSSQKANQSEDGCGDEVENDHDPHFEPIVPLPELVQVKTGEEDETVLFNFKGKVFRFDPDTKEWKERGLGNVKILKHPKNITFRVLLRREQVHKIAVNHMITKDMELKPMQSSNTAVCYYAMDFAEETLKLEHLAVRFKLEETLKEFKEVFLKCQEELRKKPASNDNEVANADKCQGLKEKLPELLNLDQFKPKADSWECQGCLVRNESKCLLCPSCGTSKPSSAPSVSTTKSDKTPGPAFVKTTPTSNSEELSFENQSLKLDGSVEATPIAESIKNHKVMKILTLAGNTIGIEAAEVIGQSLVSHPEFERAHWKDMFTGRSKAEIPPALKHLSRGIIMSNAHLVELDLSDNAFGPIGMDGIVDLLRSQSCFTLQELRLNNTGCGIAGGKVLAKTLMECYNNSGKKLALKVFVLGRSRQENAGATALAEVFKAMGSLEEVVMPQNGIYHEGIAALADAFSSNKNLKILNMNDNTFTEKGAEALARALPNLQKLTTLNLGDCLLKTRGAQLIADALKERHLDLVELNFESNEIEASGGTSIVQAIANKPKITSVNLNVNLFGKDGCNSILNQLEKIGKRHVMEEIEDDEADGHDDDDDEEEEEEDEDAEGGDDYNEGDEEDDRNNMFEGLCDLFEQKKGANGDLETVPLGQVVLRIIYDDDVYGARIVASKPNESDDEDDGEEETICNHLIAMQTELTTHDDCRRMEWSALDFSTDPPVYRHLMVKFDESEVGYDFRDNFNEGKEFAVQAEILEQPELDPKDMYYGQGGDYEDEKD